MDATAEQEATADNQVEVLDYRQLEMLITDPVDNFIRHAITLLGMRAVMRPIVKNEAERQKEERLPFNVFGTQAQTLIEAFKMFKKVRAPEVRASLICGMSVVYDFDSDLMLVSVVTTDNKEQSVMVTSVRKEVEASVANSLANVGMRIERFSATKRSALRQGILYRMKPRFSTVFKIEHHTLDA